MVLLYHRIVDGAATNVYERSIADFKEDLKYLNENKIKVIGFEDLDDMLKKGAIPSSGAAIITFDDGDHSWLTRALPLLKEYKMKATFFLWVSMIGRDSFLKWDEISVMSHYADEDGERPFSFGSHTMSHQYLLNMKAAINDQEEYNRYLDEEFGSSARIIEDYSPDEVTALSLPFGDGAGDEEIIDAAKRNGYRFIRTSEYGVMSSIWTDMYRIPCLTMLDDTESKLIGEYLGI